MERGRQICNLRCNRWRDCTTLNERRRCCLLQPVSQRQSQFDPTQLKQGCDFPKTYVRDQKRFLRTGFADQLLLSCRQFRSGLKPPEQDMRVEK